MREGCSPDLALDADRDGHASSADCNDLDPEVFPGRDEIPNDGIDQDCDGEDLVDLDRDGWSVSEGDCADQDPTIHPGAVDLCDDGVDDDCDGVALACGTLDLDGDGFSSVEGDCADDDADVGPHAIERPYDGVDQDCDPTTTDDDLDGDGAPLRYDCDDEDAERSPFAQEIAGDGIDQDCDGEDLALTDMDGDGWPTPNDCDDGDPGVHPDAEERWGDDVDQDCDGRDVLGSAYLLAELARQWRYGRRGGAALAGWDDVRLFDDAGALLATHEAELAHVVPLASGDYLVVDADDEGRIGARRLGRDGSISPRNTSGASIEPASRMDVWTCGYELGGEAIVWFAIHASIMRLRFTLDGSLLSVETPESGVGFCHAIDGAAFEVREDGVFGNAVVFRNDGTGWEAVDLGRSVRSWLATPHGVLARPSTTTVRLVTADSVLPSRAIPTGTTPAGVRRSGETWELVVHASDDVWVYPWSGSEGRLIAAGAVRGPYPVHGTGVGIPHVGTFGGRTVVHLGTSVLLGMRVTRLWTEEP